MRSLQLDPLLTDLAARHVPEEQIAAELELAWWRSALDNLLAGDRALLGARTDVLERLEADFRLVDEAHAAGSAQLLAWQLAENWKIGLVDWPDEAHDLKQLLAVEGITSAALQHSAPHLARSVAPIWLASPYEIDADHRRDARSTPCCWSTPGATTVAENVGAIRRAKQVVAFGDPVTQTPSAFEIGLSIRMPRDRVDAGGSTARMRAPSTSCTPGRRSRALPSCCRASRLTRSYRAGGEDLAELVNRRFYGGRIDSLPWAGSFLGHGSLVLDYVERRHRHARRRHRRGRERRRRGEPRRRAGARARRGASARVADGGHREREARRARAAGRARGDDRRVPSSASSCWATAQKPSRCCRSSAPSRRAATGSSSRSATAAPRTGACSPTSARSASRAASACSRSR